MMLLKSVRNQENLCLNSLYYNKYLKIKTEISNIENLLLNKEKNIHKKYIKREKKVIIIIKKNCYNIKF